jgi:hypothetical protein
VIAHSLGGIACVDLLIGKAHPNVDLLVTCGSQAPLLYELGAAALAQAEEVLARILPEDLAELLRLQRPAQLQGGGGVRLARARDARHRDRQQAAVPISHSAYWDQKKLWDRLKPYLE